MNPALLLLIIAVPLFASAMTVLIRARVFERALLIAVPVFVFVFGIVLLVYHQQVPVIAHSVGGYEDGLAIPFVSDTFTALMLIVTSLAAFVCCLFLVITGEDQYRFVPSLVLMMLSGVYGAFLTGDLFNLFVFIEVMVLPSYALIAVTGTWRRLGVGRMFVIVNLLISTILVIGVGFVYGAAGTVNIASIAAIGHVSPQLSLAVGFVLVAFLGKAGAAPMHGWLIRSYPNTSAGMMALFSALHTKVGLYAVYRVYTAVFGQPAPWAWVLVALVVLTILLSVISAFGEHRARNVLAFTMSNGVGHILIGVALMTAAALSAGMYYLIHHIITMAGLLLVLGAIEQTYGTGAFKKLSGLARREKPATVLMVLGLFSIIGLPPTSGLWGKVGLILASASADRPGSWIIIAAIVIGSVIGLMALQRMWSNTFWGKDMTIYHPDSKQTGRAPATELTDDVRIPNRLLVPGAIMIAVSVFLFFGAQLVIPFTQRAAEGLLNITPYLEAVLGHV